MKQLLVLICLLVASLDASAQNWFRTAGPVEDDVLDLCIDSNGILYAVTPLGVNRSTDGGATWTRPFLFPQLTTDSRVMVAPNGNVIASTDRDIFVSSDQGVTFYAKRTTAGNLQPVLQFATSENGKIFAAAGYGFMRSDDNGMNWEDAFRAGIPSKPSPSIVAVAATHNRMYLVANAYLFGSIDEGNSWSSLYVSSPLQKLLIHPSGTVFGVYNSGFEGRMLQYTPGEWVLFGSFNYNFKLFTADMMLDGTILASGQRGVYLVKNLENWIDVSDGFEKVNTVYRRVTKFVEDPMRGIYYASTFGAGVWKSAAVLQSIGDGQEPSRFSVTPNPFTDRTTIHLTEANPSWAELELRNILGAVVWKQGREYCPSGTNTLSIADHGLPPGNYLLVLRTNERTETQWVTIVQ